MRTPQRSKIEWTDYTVNPIKGLCKGGCPCCYAIKMYRRFKWNSEIRYDWTVFKGIENLKAGSKIFVGSTHDVFGDWIDSQWIIDILKVIKDFPELIFIFLTKNPKRYSEFAFPKNAWIGYSTTGELFHKWEGGHKDNIKFVSLEPMAEPIRASLDGFAQKIDFQWLIIGQVTGYKSEKYIVTASMLLSTLEFARKVGFQIFVKNNLKDHFSETLVPILKIAPQEFPKEKIK